MTERNGNVTAVTIRAVATSRDGFDKPGAELRVEMIDHGTKYSSGLAFVADPADFVHQRQLGP